jgi:hypothetical protein
MKAKFVTVLTLCAMVISSCKQPTSTSTSVSESTSAPVSDTTSVSTSTSTSTSTEPGTNLSGDPKTYQTQGIADSDICLFAQALSGHHYPNVAFVEMEERDALQGIFKGSGLSTEDIHSVVTLVFDATMIPASATYSEYKTKVKDLRTRLLALVDAVEGDQLSYMVMTVLNYLRRSNSESPMVSNITNLIDFNAASATLSGDNKAAFDKMRAFFDGSVSWNVPIDFSSIAQADQVVLGRFIKNLLAAVLNHLDETDFIRVVDALFNFTKISCNLKSDKAFQADITALMAGLPSLANKLGAAFKEAQPSASSFELIHTALVHIADFVFGAIDTIASGDFAIKENREAFLATANAIKGAVTTDVLAAVYDLLTNILAAFDSDDLSAISAIKTTNPIPTLLPTFDAAFALLSTAEQTAIKSVFTFLGLDYDKVHTALDGFKDTDFSDEDQLKTFGTYIQTLEATVLTKVVPAVPYSDYGLSYNDQLLPDHVFKDTDFKVSLTDSEGNDLTKITIKTLPTFDSTLGYHSADLVVEGVVTAEDGTETKKSATIAFDYTVYPQDTFVQYVYCSTTDSGVNAKISYDLGVSADSDAVPLVFPKNLSLDDQKLITIRPRLYNVTEDSHSDGTGALLSTANTGAGIDTSTLGMHYTSFTAGAYTFPFAYYVYDAGDTTATYESMDSGYVILNGEKDVEYGKYYSLKDFAVGKPTDLTQQIKGTMLELTSTDDSITLEGTDTAALGAKTKASEDKNYTASYTVVDDKACTLDRVDTLTFGTQSRYPGNTFTFDLNSTPTLDSITGDYLYGTQKAGSLTEADPVVSGLSIDTSAVTTSSKTATFVYRSKKISFNYKVVQQIV